MRMRKDTAVRGFRAMPPKATPQERLAVIEGAIREIESRSDLSPEAKARGIRALERARARALPHAGGK